MITTSFVHTNQVRPGTQIASSTGGTITWTKTGLVHSAGKNFSGLSAAAVPESAAEAQPQPPRRGRGRPRKQI
jgi:hypothetical protein